MASKNILVDLNLNKNELQNAVIQNLASAPANAVAGQLYYDTVSKALFVFDGTNWVAGKAYTFASPLSVDSNYEVSVAASSTSSPGVIEIATDVEASTGTSETLAVNPKQLATKLNANAAITAGTATKVTYDTKGLVTAGTSLSSSDIPDISATYVPQTAVGAASGVCPLGSDSKIATTYLPSYVDDVVDSYVVSGATAYSAGWLSETDGGAALTPATGKIYVVLSAGEYQNKTYRWSGTTYVEISSSPAQATESVAGIAAIATQVEVGTGTNDTKFVTPLKLATYVQGMANKVTSTNPALTASSGVCTWTITNSLGTADVIVSIYDVSTGDKVFTTVTVASGTITIKINSSSNISAGAYKAVIIG